MSHNPDGTRVYLLFVSPDGTTHLIPVQLLEDFPQALASLSADAAQYVLPVPPAATSRSALIFSRRSCRST